MSPDTSAPKPKPIAPLPAKKPGVQFQTRATPTQALTAQPKTPASYQFMPPRTPLPSNSMLPPRASPTAQNRLPSVVKTNQPDTFLELIRGPTLTLLIGLPPSQQTYTLPSALLSAQSFFFKNELARVLVQCMSKKRKLRFSDEDEGEDGDVKEVVPSGNETASQKADDVKNADDKNGNESEVKEARTNPPSIKTEANNIDGSYTPWNAEFTSSAILKLPDIDPAIFGLFLKFIYQGSYPANVDAGRVPYAQPSNLVNGAQSTGAGATSSSTAPIGGGGGVSRYSPYPPTSGSGSTSSVGMSMPTLSTVPTGSTAAPSRPNMPPLVTTTLQTIPPSISAYLLATRLHAPTFTNHTLTHIYAGIGVYFVLTPFLIEHVWTQTKSSTFSSTILPSNSTGFSNNTSTSGFTGSKSPLRHLLLDVLTLHWSSNASGHIIARSETLRDEWNRVFDVHQDLRRDFIVGMQGGERRVGAVQEYFVGFEGGSAGGGNGQVVVKKEGN